MFTNSIGLLVNFIDFVYYPYTQSRMTWAVFDIISNQDNFSDLLGVFFRFYWFLVIIFIIFIFLWAKLYKLVKLKDYKIHSIKRYLAVSLVWLAIVTLVVVAGARGSDLKKRTRPINLVDATRHVKNILHADIVLNTPFTLIRTFKKNKFKNPHFLENNTANEIIHPIKRYDSDSLNKKNVVILILESFGREYLGAFNKGTAIKDYKSYTPFLDSLSQKSLIFPNAFANGRKSIHAMSSVLCGLPSFQVAFTSSPYAKQRIQSLVSELNGLGYDTSFFCGSLNGSMGFLGFANILGFDHYYGKDEFGDDSEFDGVWGIWDEPFFKYMGKTLSQKEEPFMATLFSTSSHHPFKVPKKYENSFDKGTLQIHKTLGYTDFALKQFFNSIKDKPWFQNTLFVITADHTNQTWYSEYKKPINRFAVPILFYDPNDDIAKQNDNLAQQIDIYPTILNAIGYKKPFFSLGRSLIDPQSKPFVITHNGNVFYVLGQKYICIFDGQKTIGFYHINDKELKNKLIRNADEDMLELEKHGKAFIQNYMSRVMERKLYYKP